MTIAQRNVAIVGALFAARIRQPPAHALSQFVLWADFHVLQCAVETTLAVTAANVDALDAQLRRNGRFSELITLRAPSVDQARLMLTRRIASIVGRSGGDASESEAAVDALAAEIAPRCRGIVGGDVEQLCDLAALEALHVRRGRSSASCVSRR